MRGIVAATLGGLVVLSTGSALAQKASPISREDAEEKTAFEEVCGSCHSVGMVEGIRSGLEWKQTVEEMVKIGAKGTDQQMDRLMRFLARNMTKVNVNTATAPEIAPVLAVSETTAQAIVKRRTEKGNFKTIEELKKIPGVDAAKLEARQDRVVF